MSGQPGRSGGHNRLRDEEHARRGTKPNFRADIVSGASTAPPRGPSPRGLETPPRRPSTAFQWAISTPGGPRPGLRPRLLEPLSGLVPAGPGAAPEKRPAPHQIEAARGTKQESTLRPQLVAVLPAEAGVTVDQKPASKIPCRTRCGVPLDLTPRGPPSADAMNVSVGAPYPRQPCLVAVCSPR